jgi:hypothetical protein
MIAFEVARPPTKSMRKAANHMSETRTYLFSSTDPTATYLKTGLVMVNETSRLWELAEGNSTSSYNEIARGMSYCEMFRTVLLWLTNPLNEQNPNASKSEEMEYFLSRFVRQDGRLRTLIKEWMEGGSVKSLSVVESSGDFLCK